MSPGASRHSPSRATRMSASVSASNTVGPPSTDKAHTAPTKASALACASARACNATLLPPEATPTAPATAAGATFAPASLPPLHSLLLARHRRLAAERRRRRRCWRQLLWGRPRCFLHRQLCRRHRRCRRPASSCVQRLTATPAGPDPPPAPATASAAPLADTQPGPVREV
eukprot:360597-Chlamydomonas_euryale.AAC.1